mgnify:FL=1
MNKLLAAMFVALLMAGCGGDGDSGSDGSESNESSAETPPDKTAEAPKVVVDFDQLELRDGLWHCEGKPFTGIAVEKYKSGQKKVEGTYKDGKQHGLWTNWHENGQKYMEGTHKDGKANGMVTWWYENGQKSLEATYKDDEQISLKEWDRDGNPESTPYLRNILRNN